VGTYLFITLKKQEIKKISLLYVRQDKKMVLVEDQNCPKFEVCKLWKEGKSYVDK